MNSENNTEDASRNGRRSTDDSDTKEVFSPPSGGLLRWLLNGVAVGGVIAVLFYSGRASRLLDSTVASNARQDQKIEFIITQLHTNDIEQNRLLSMLENTVIQQKRSDDEFLRELKETREKLNDIDHGVRGNREAIIIMNGKVTSVDKTRVNYLASR
jgi:hypothetical protein